MTEQPKFKKGFFKRMISGIVRSPLVRGIVKSLPFGNVVYEIGENVMGETLNQTKESEASPDKDTKPHSAISLLCQIVVLGLIVYAFVTKTITIQDVLDILGVTADDFKNDIVPPTVINVIADTLK